MQNRLREYFRTQNRIREYLTPEAPAPSSVVLVRLPNCCTCASSAGYQSLYALAFERARESARSWW